MLLATLFRRFPFLLMLYADGGYQGPEFKRALKRILSQVEIARRSYQARNQFKPRLCQGVPAGLRYVLLTFLLWYQVLAERLTPAAALPR